MRTQRPPAAIEEMRHILQEHLTSLSFWRQRRLSHQPRAERSGALGSRPQSPFRALKARFIWAQLRKSSPLRTTLSQSSQHFGWTGTDLRISSGISPAIAHSIISSGLSWCVPRA